MKSQLTGLSKPQNNCDYFEWSAGMAHNGSAMSSGGFGTTHLSNCTNDNRKHKRQITHCPRHYL